MRTVEGKRSSGHFKKKYRAKIIPSKSFWLRRSGFRYQLWSYWLEWSWEWTSSWYENKDDCIKAAHKHLDEIENFNNIVKEDFI